MDDISEILAALEAAASQTYWACIRDHWAKFHEHRNWSDEWARVGNDRPEQRQVALLYRKQEMNHAEILRVAAIEAAAPFWRAYGRLREVAPTLLSELPLLPDDDPQTYEPRTLAMAVRRVANALRAMGGDVTEAASQRTTRETSLNTLLLELLVEESEIIHFSSREIAERIEAKYGRKCSHTAIQNTTTWRERILAARALEQAERVTRRKGK